MILCEVQVWCWWQTAGAGWSVLLELLSHSQTLQVATCQLKFLSSSEQQFYISLIYFINIDTMIVIVLLVVLASNLQAQDVVIQRHFKGDIYTSSKLKSFYLLYSLHKLFPTFFIYILIDLIL